MRIFVLYAANNIRYLSTVFNSSIFFTKSCGFLFLYAANNIRYLSTVFNIVVFFYKKLRIFVLYAANNICYLFHAKQFFGTSCFRMVWRIELIGYADPTFILTQIRVCSYWNYENWSSFKDLKLLKLLKSNLL